MSVSSAVNVKQGGGASDAKGRDRWLAGHPTRENHEEIMKKVMKSWSSFVTDESIEKSMAFSFLPGDAVIATHSKSGTTMMQQIVHQLRTGGDMDFDEISRVVPFMELAHDCEIDLTADQTPAAPPRAFKTHFGWKEIPKTRIEDGTLAAKYIYVARDPISVAVSFYKFLLDWFYTAEECRLCDFVDIFLYQRGTPYWDHVADYFRAATAKENDGRVLWLFFEDIIADQEGAIRSVADFIGIRDKVANEEDYEERVQTALRMSSLAFMRENEYHFDEKISKKYRNEAIGAVEGGQGGRKVRIGDKIELTPLLREELETVLGEELQRVLGVGSYAELREKAKKTDGLQLFRPASLAK